MMIDIIFSQLLVNQEYFSRVWPFLNDDYFDKGPPKNLFNSIKKHVDSYNSVPSKVALRLALSNTKMPEIEAKGTLDLLNELSDEKESNDWLVAETENYVKKTAVYNATSQIILIQTNADLPPEKQDRRIPDIGAIPDIMREALSVCFDSEVGHNWLDDYEARWLSYLNKTRKIPFKLNILNRITKGGAENATLNILMAGSNVGKSLGLCSLAADYLQMGQNVLYISMEMSEEVCAKRIDANLLDVTLDDIDDGKVSYAEYKSKMERWRESNVLGKLYIKQYATGTANANTFRGLINELKLKKNFVPTIIMIDYLGICGSCRIKTYTENSYTLVKAIAEELRALAFDTNTCIWSAAQTTRGGWDTSDMKLSDVAESAGLVHTADFMLGVIETDELAKQGTQMFKQLKSRYGDKNINNVFYMTVKKGNQRWVEQDSGYKQHKIPESKTSMFDKPKSLTDDFSDFVTTTTETNVIDDPKPIPSSTDIIMDSIEAPKPKPHVIDDFSNVKSTTAPSRKELDDFYNEFKL